MGRTKFPSLEARDERVPPVYQYFGAFVGALLNQSFNTRFAFSRYHGAHLNSLLPTRILPGRDAAASAMDFEKPPLRPADRDRRVTPPNTVAPHTRMHFHPRRG